jgi:glutathione synthase/RimK-type ligase-like ATP-grasp enzyme
MIAIHHRSESFSERWISYCKENNIPYKVVNCYDNDIIEQLKDCEAVMWHYHHGSYKDSLFAKQLLFSLEGSGKKVFPDFATAWHFDDKVGQKYLLESIGAQLVPSFVFYDKASALSWAKSASYPKVFKLRGGAGSSNVKLIRSYNEARKVISTAFGKGFSQFDGLSYFIDKFNKFKSGLISFKSVVKSSGRIFFPTEYAKMRGREKGYAYFQEFIPNNDSDIRIIVVDGKAFGIKRMVRANDFRASGSGKIDYQKENFDANTLKMAFDITDKLNSKACVLDFIYDKENKPLVVEVSYGYTAKAYDSCIGYWDKELNFYEGEFNPYGWMVQELLKK